jgi:hypothetical protein
MTDPVTILGEYRDAFEGTAVTESRVHLKSDDLFQNWRRVSLSADFIARYYSYFFPYKEKAQEILDRESAENSISFVLNELIENTAKYSDAGNKEVEITVWMLGTFVLFNVSNFVKEELAGSFLKVAREILDGDPEELYIRKLEKNIEETTGGSGLGYLTLINDFGVALGFKLEKMGQDLVKVTVQAKMKYKEA